jgi:hypothetical protein
MNKKYRVVVSDNVTVQVEGKLSGEDGKPQPFKFSLLCKRLGAQEIKAEVENEALAADMVTRVVHGWKDQRLVLEDDGTPAEFCEEALEALLSIGGMGMQILSAYLKEVGVKAKN